MERKKKLSMLQFLFCLPLGIGRWIGFSCTVIRSFSWEKSLIRSVYLQGYDIGVRSLSITVLTGIVSGIVLALQSYYQLGMHGLSCAIGFFVVKSILVEIGPVLTALALSGKVSGAIAVFLGTLRMTEQVSAMKTLGENPLKYFALPRIIAGVLVMPVLVIIAIWSGILAGYGICRYVFQIPSRVYWSMTFGNVLFSDLLMVIIKSLVFGFIITSLGCYYGLAHHRRISGITDVITAGMVASYVSIVFINCVITTLFHVLC
ncbi:MlaE family ABC transporter permease [Candidatus Chlamydia sanziniae]|uniref:ABC transporter n=1 Tax=Candidatus Chlamydia sanziniae TaxID=1806891 RepID=A0A1A9HWV6_9CHLA|nr:ABC transporter permease [Candidatus Chlamydia sanziniae]ANH78921.1 ABC transporter [Candidatus Chlamydia sanziniae]